jgi:hypothetical protein
VPYGVNGPRLHARLGGWPSNGFSQSSGIPHTWNMWIVYPFVAYLMYLAPCSRRYVGRRPISEGEIEHEMHQQASRH